MLIIATVSIRRKVIITVLHQIHSALQTLIRMGLPPMDLLVDLLVGLQMNLLLTSSLMAGRNRLAMDGL